MHELLSAIESTQKQNIELTTKLAELVFYGFKEEYGDYSTISPSFHRALQHSAFFMKHYQDHGHTIGKLSECAQEAINFDTKEDVKNIHSWGPTQYKI